MMDTQLHDGVVSILSSAKHLIVINWLTVFQDLAVFMASVLVVMIVWDFITRQIKTSSDTNGGTNDHSMGKVSNNDFQGWVDANNFDTDWNDNKAHNYGKDDMGDTYKVGQKGGQWEKDTKKLNRSIKALLKEQKEMM